MAEDSRTSPNAPASAAPTPARSANGASGPGLSSTISIAANNEAVDELGATVAGDFSAAALAQPSTTPHAGAGASVARVIPVGSPTTNDAAELVAAPTDGAQTNAAAAMPKKPHAQTLAGLAPPPELKAEADAILAQRKAAQAANAARPGAPPSAPPKLQLPPPRPAAGKPGSTPPPPPSAALRAPGSAPGFAAPPRPGASTPPPGSAMKPPPLPPAVGVPALRPSTPAPPATGFVPQEPGNMRSTGQAMPAMAPPPMPPADPRRSSQQMPAVTPPPAPTDPRRSSQQMPAVTPPPAPADPRRSSSAMPAVVMPAMLPAHNPSTDKMEPVGGASSPSGYAHAPPKMIYAPGTVIAGKYRLERPLGQGGMGSVWVVRNLSLDAEFAIKLIRRDRATEEAAARLLTEARAAAKLGHPGIVRVFDFGQTEVGDPYLVMEMLAGDSLGALISRKKRLEPAVAVQMLLPVASALSAAHAKGIVHRDLKPDNIMLATEEQSRKLVPKVLDFGIARVLRDDIERHQTMAGEVLGSPDYMSPEQARGQLDIDHRTDIWTFCVLLYEAITGKRPFEGHNYNALIASIVSNPPMPIHAYGIADAELSGIIDRGLSKSPTARWQTMRDVGVALAQWAVDHGIQQDITGLSIQSEWLASAAPRLLTLQPAQMPRMQVPGAEPAHSTAPVVSKDGAEWQGLRGDGRKKWFVGAGIAATVLVLLLIGTNIGSLFSDSAGPGSEADAGTSAQTSASAAPSTTPVPAATPSEAPTSQPSAKASASASAKTKTPVVGPPRKKAPPVPTNIKF